jgi:hypothetical protein
MHRAISALGHVPVMSEHPSFPVLPNVTTIENCRRNVREHTDVFLLIIGGRRGSLDPQSNKPITNIEYETAVESGLDIFVFIDQKILNVLPIWEKNPSADFSRLLTHLTFLPL